MPTLSESSATVVLRIPFVSKSRFLDLSAYLQAFFLAEYYGHYRFLLP